MLSLDLPVERGAYFDRWEAVRVVVEVTYFLLSHQLPVDLVPDLDVRVQVPI